MRKNGKGLGITFNLTVGELGNWSLEVITTFVLLISL